MVSIGFFDGVHKGHVYLLKQLMNEANSKNQEELVITLWPHPAKYFGKNISLLNTLNEKIVLLEGLGIKNVLILDFNEELASLSANMFVENILKEKLSCSSIIMGYNNHFGNKNSTSKPESEFAIPVKRLQKFEFEEFTNINSSQIRECITQGDLEKANKMLGYNYKLSGNIISGYQIGRKLGFPTANLQLDVSKLIPKAGVYEVDVSFENASFKGMLNIGTRPTLQGEKQTIEVHILDFEKDIYGKTLILKFRKRLRDERKFDSIKDLKAQLEYDKMLINNN